MIPSELPGLAELLDQLPALADLDVEVEGTEWGAVLRAAAARKLQTDQHDQQEGTE